MDTVDGSRVGAPDDGEKVVALPLVDVATECPGEGDIGRAEHGRENGLKLAW